MLQYKIKLFFYATKFQKKTVVIRGRPPSHAEVQTAEARQERDIECVYQGRTAGPCARVRSYLHRLSRSPALLLLIWLGGI